MAVRFCLGVAGIGSSCLALWAPAGRAIATAAAVSRVAAMARRAFVTGPPLLPVHVSREEVARLFSDAHQWLVRIAFCQPAGQPAPASRHEHLTARLARLLQRDFRGLDLAGHPGGSGHETSFVVGHVCAVDVAGGSATAPGAAAAAAAAAAGAAAAAAAAGRPETVLTSGARSDAGADRALL